MKRAAALAIFLFFSFGAAAQQLPNRAGSFRFGVIGDSGTGGTRQYTIGALLGEYQKSLGFQTVLMLGDNIYGRHRPKDFRKKFELPYQALLDAGVKFHAALGNHDSASQTFYKPFNMEGRRYYTFSPREGIRFFALDSTFMDKPQLEWIEKELAGSGSGWKIVYFHHPIYSSGARHGSDLPLRAVLEPLFVKYGVSLVLAGHDHFYERIKPQQGIYYFVIGGSAKLRARNVRRTPLTAKAFDLDNSFAVMEIDRDTLHFQAIGRKGATVDFGSFERVSASVGSRPARPGQKKSDTASELRIAPSSAAP